MTRILTVSLFTLNWVFLSAVSAQQSVKNTFFNIEPRACEFNNLILEQATREAGQDSVLILIARSGIKDTQKDISEKRLYTARAYLVEYSNLRKSENIVVAEAGRDKTLNYGGVEIYAKGKLLDVLTSLPNAGLGLGSCDHPDAEDDKSRAKNALLYPWLYKKIRSKK